MLEFLFFIMICYTLSFAVVYKQPKVVQPVIWLFSKIGLRDATTCMLCMPMYFAFGLSALDFFFLNDINFTPMSLLTNDIGDINIGIFTNDLYLSIISVFYVVFDGLIAAGTVFLIDTLQNYFERVTNYYEK